MIVVRKSRPKAPVYFGMISAGLLLAGCTPSKKPVLPQPPPVHVDRWGTEAALRRVQSLNKEAENLASDAKLLPGGNAAEHSREMQRIFTDLIQTLTLMGNPADDRVLAQRLTIIQTSRAALATGSTSIPIEPNIDNALRAAVAAISDLSHSDLFEQADLGTDLDSLSALLSRLDLSESKPELHRVDVTETVDLASKVVSKLSTSLNSRLTTSQPGAPTTMSAPPGSASPGTMPASAPAGVPTPEPSAPATAPAADPAATTPPAGPATAPAAPELNK